MATYLILACDGGGIRGYITTSVLQQLVGDARVGNFLPQVSLRAGTSTLFTRNPAITGGTTHDSMPAQTTGTDVTPKFPLLALMDAGAAEIASDAYAAVTTWLRTHFPTGQA